MSTLFITHDLSTVHYLGGDVMVIHRGQGRREGPVSRVMTDPSTRTPPGCCPRCPIPDPNRRWKDRIELSAVEGEADSSTVVTPEQTGRL